MWSFLMASIFVSAERSLKNDSALYKAADSYGVLKFLWQSDGSGYQHVWPEMEFGWKIVLGSIFGFLGAAFGSIGGVGGGGIFVPMLTLIIGFDPKSAAAISKCTSTNAFMRGVETWKKETIMMQEAIKRVEADVTGGDYELLPGGPSNDASREPKDLAEPEVSFIDNVCWKEFGLLVIVWFAFLALQIIKNNTVTCSAGYWLVNLLQIPVSVGVSSYEAISLCKGWRKISSSGDAGRNFQVSQLITYCFIGVMAGIVGGLLGVGGGSIMGPLFLELGVPPQVSSATATFAMMFSSSMSVVEYYLLKRFPVPYALYFLVVAIIAAFIGQHVVRRVITMLGRASIIIFILAAMIFVSAFSLGGVGISNMIGKIQRHEYMGFENFCEYQV